MSDNKKIHLSVWIAWLVLHGYLLIFHFSPGNLAVLALAALFLLLGTFFSSKHEDGSLCTTIGTVVGVSLFVRLGWRFVEAVLPTIVALCARDENIFEWFVGRTADLTVYLYDDAVMLGTVCLAVVLFVVRLCLGRWPVASMLVSYASNAALMLPILGRLYNSRALVLLYLAVMVVFIWADQWNIAVNNEWNKCGRRWANWLTVLLLLCFIVNRGMLTPLTQSGALETIFVLNATNFMNMLVVSVVAVALFVVILEVDPAGVCSTGDLKILLTGYFALLLTAILKNNYLNWWWILALVYVGCVLADVLFIQPQLKDDIDNTGVSMLVQAALSAVIWGVVVLCHRGILLEVLAALFGLAVAVVGVAWCLDQDNEKLKLPGSIASVLAGILIPALTWIWKYRRLAYFVWLLLIMAAVVLVITVLMSFHVVEKDRKNILVPMAALAAFTVLSLNVMNTGGSRIKMELDEQLAPVVTVEARDEESSIVSVHYLWKGASLDTQSWTVTFPDEGYEEPSSLAGKAGRLRVIATDSNGIVTETVFWLSGKAEG